MPFDWNLYLVLAEQLGAQTSNEAAQRSAVSRAYYAIFCRARNQLCGSDTDISHYALWKEYMSLGGTRRSIGRHGDRLRLHRHRIDYKNEVAKLPDIVEDTLRTARNVMTYLDGLTSGSF